MRFERIFLTGSSGYIAGRWIEIHGSNRRITGLTRDPRKAPQLHRYGPDQLSICVGDVRDTAALAEGMSGCEAVVHAAFGIDGDQANCRSVTYGGTVAALEAARRAGVRRFVLISSWVVYELETGGVVDESSPAPRQPSHYASAKLDAERHALEFCRSHGIELIILQPSMVYGPRSSIFTTPYLEALHHGDLVLIDGGGNPCNLVHVDDVALAIECALESERADGERYLVSHPELVSWRQFLEGYQSMWGSPCLAEKPMDAIRAERRWGDRLRGLVRSAPATWRVLRSDPELARELYRLPLPQALKRFSPGLLRWVRTVYSRRTPAGPVTSDQSAPSTTAASRDAIPVTDDMILTQSRTVRADCGRAMGELGWRPTFDLAESMASIESWARHIGLLKPWATSMAPERVI